MSRTRWCFHFLRHQRVCFDRMLAMVRGSELEALPLDELIRVTERIRRNTCCIATRRKSGITICSGARCAPWRRPGARAGR